MNASRTRIVAVVVIVVAFIALTTFALLARAYRPGRSGVHVPAALAAQIAQSVASVAPIMPPAPTPVVAPARESVAAPAPPVEVTPGPPPATPPTPAPRTNNLAPCPLGLATPTEPAGLANLVGLVPVFGPFSPEAFAMVPAFEPGFPLFGPLIIAGGQQLDANADGMNALVGVVHPLEQAGYDALSPAYAPYRQQFLAAEASLAMAMQPGVAAFADLPGASCLPAAEAAVVGGS